MARACRYYHSEHDFHTTINKRSQSTDIFSTNNVCKPLRLYRDIAKKIKHSWLVTRLG